MSIINSYMKKKLLNFKKDISLTSGFTIVETLVAITILMISIAGPLTVAHKGLLAANYAADQVTAAYLVQDMIEYIKNVKDNNIIRNDPVWLNGLINCVQASPCNVDTVNNVPYDRNGIQNCGSNCVLSNVSTGGTTRVTQYSRYFYVTPSAVNPLDEATVTVVISWDKGTINNKYTFDNEIFRVLR